MFPWTGTKELGVHGLSLGCSQSLRDGKGEYTFTPVGDATRIDAEVFVWRSKRNETSTVTLTEAAFLEVERIAAEYDAETERIFADPKPGVTFRATF